MEQILQQFPVMQSTLKYLYKNNSYWVMEGATMSKDGYSIKGFFGETIHYDSNGNKIGESRPNFWGGVDHFDANGNKTGHSEKSFFGGMNHYDNNDNKTGHSQQGFWGQTNHYDNHGNKTGESTRDFLGGSHYHGTGSSFSNSAVEDEYNAIEAEMMDETYDSEEAAEWLIDNGYDPDDFDL